MYQHLESVRVMLKPRAFWISTQRWINSGSGLLNFSLSLSLGRSVDDRPNIRDVGGKRIDADFLRDNRAVRSNNIGTPTETIR